MDSFETRNEFTDAQDNGNADMEQARAMQGNAAPATGARAGDTILQPDANGVVVLPEGASLENMSAQGRDLVIVLEDGSRIIIPEGAIIVPQIVVDGVTVPAANLAALLTGNEPQPAAGDPQSSGGNFEQDPGNIQDAYAIGNLLPYTELQFAPPEEREIIPDIVDEEPVIVIETPDNPVGVINAIASVDEDGLPARNIDGADEPQGTRAETNSETATGTIVFDAPDGVAEVQINGVAITAIGQTFQGELGLLTITSIDLAGGEIGFSYTLEDNMVVNGLDGSFVMTVFDSDGDRADATLQINVIDDAPIAADDVGEVAAGTFGPIGGNVLVNDVSGADGYAAAGAVSGFSNAGGSADAGGTLTGTYGELTLEADGTYSYTRFFNTPGGVSETFDYTIVDADGSTSTATLTINIGDAPDSVTGVPEGEDATVVDEDELPPTTGTRDGEPEGSDFDGDDETATGTITFTSPDGVGSVSIGGTVIDPDNLPQDVVTDGTGTLTVTGYTYDPATGEGTITYVYTLTDNTSDPEGTTVTFPIVIVDLDGDVAEDELEITIIDDVPEANDDTGDQGAENAPVTVDVIANDVTGADGVDLATGVEADAGTLSGTGSLAYNGDGTFTYTPGPGEEGTVTFDYTITDGDGDTSTATVTITLQPDSTPEIGVEGDDTVFEEALAARTGEPAGSNEASDGEFASGNINIATGNDSVGSLVINSIDVTGGGTVTTARGVLTVTLTDGQYSYSYELTDNTLVDPDSDSFTLVVTDSDGDTAQTTLVINIVDDNPSAEDDANAIAAGEYGPVGGNVLDNDTQGADGAAVTSYTGANGSGTVGQIVQGEYGTLTIAADGTYSYTRDAGTEGGVSDTFTYTITDGDGDTATADLVIAIADSPVVLDLPVAGGDGTLVDEAGLPAGSDAASDSEFTSGTFTYDAPDGPATVTINGTPVAVGETISGSFGTLTITSVAEGSIGYTYELTTNTNGDDTFDSFAVVVTDQDDDFASGNLDIAIVDDVPTAVADTDSVTEDGPLVANGNVITDAEANGDNGADTTGADGASVTNVAFGGSDGTVGGATAGAYGSLVLNADGSYTYTLDNANEFVQGLDSTESLTEVFTYTLTDGDGDPSVTTLTITINGADDIVTINGLDLDTPELTVDEDDLPGGSSPDAGALVQSGQFTVDSPDGLDTLTVGGVQVWGAGETYPIAIAGQYGEVRITGVVVTTDANGDVVEATVSYEYELSTNTLDHDLAGEDSLVDSLEVVATDTDGSQDSASLDIEVIDDIPAATDNTNSVTEGDSTTGNLLTDDDGFGVDISGADGPITILDVTGSGGSDDGAPFVVTGTYGQLTVQADGSYTYQSSANVTNVDVSDSFTYRIVDADGDIAEATLAIDISNVAGTVDDNDALVDEAGLPAGSSVDSSIATDNDGQITVTNATGPFSYVLISSATGTYGTLTLDEDTGAYSYTLTSAVDGDSLVPSEGGDNGTNTVNGQESFDYEVYDSLGNFIGSGTIEVGIIDDVPSIDATVVDGDSVTLTTQDADTVGGSDTDVSTADFGGAFSIADFAYGADGAGSIVWDYSLSVQQANSGLFSDGVPVTLAMSGDVVEGRANGVLVFTLEVNETTGVVTLTQFEAIDHALPGDSSNYDSQLAVLGDGLVTLSGVATITDGDGDTALDGAVLDLGGNVRFADDGPSIDAAVVDGDTVTLTTQDADTVGGSDTDVSAANFGSAFSVNSSNYGADGAGSIAWNFTLVIDNATSGLSSGGEPVMLSMNGDVVEGYADGVLVFSVAVDSSTGVVTLTQYEAIDHDLPGDSSNYDSQLAVLADGVLSLSGTATITDDDGDTAEDTEVLDLGGNIRFADDGPIADPDTNTLTEDTPSVGGNVIADDDFGADGAGDPEVVAVTGFGGASGTVGGSTAGEYGTLTLNGDGTYTYNLNTAAVQWLDDNESLLDSFTYTIVDADGDTSTTTLNITITGLNDAPIAADDTNWVLDVTIGADPTTTGNVLINLDHPGAPSGTFADVVDTDVEADTLSVTGVTGGTVGASLAGTYGAIVINSDGTYTYTLDSDNAAVDALDDGETLTDSFTYTVSDGDLTDTATVTITIFGTNDAPTVGGDVVTVSDEGLVGGNQDSVGVPFDTTNSNTANGTVAVADVDGDSLTVTLGEPTSGTLESGGLAVQWAIQDSGKTLVGYTNDINDPVLTVTIDDNGNFTVTQLKQIDHPTEGVEDVLNGLSALVIPVTADDGTTTTTNANAITIDFEDDSPIIGTFSPDTTFVANVANATATGTFTYSPGGDGHGSFIINAPAIEGITYQPVVQTMVDLTDDGVDNPIAGAVLVGTATEGGQAIFQFAVDVDGNYEFELLEPELATSEDLSFANLSAGGPGFRELEDDPATLDVNENGRVEFTSNGSGVNANNNNFGVSNSFLDAGEFFEAEFHNPGTDGDQTALTDAEFLSSVDINVNTLRNAGGPNVGGDSTGPTVTIQWTAYNDLTLEQETGTITVDSSGSFNIDPDIEFNRIKIENVDQLGNANDGGRIQIGGFTIYKTLLPQDQEFNFQVSAVDSDGDPTGTVANLSVTLDADLVSSMEVLDKASFSETLDLAVNDNDLFASSLSTSSNNGPRPGMRGLETATVAALASGFFMPETFTNLSQTFGETAFAGGQMVNFEFAGGLEVAAPQLPEGFAMDFGGFVETAPATFEGPMMANILEGSAFEMPQFEMAGGIDTGGVDLMAQTGGAPQFATGPSVFEGFAGMDAAASAMEGLLLLQAPAQIVEATSGMEPGKALGEAIADIAAEAQVDAIVDHFAPGGGPVMAVTPMEGLLDSTVGSDMALYQNMTLATQDQTDEAAVLAAASA